MASSKRESLGQRLRFEILKRDKFRCSYCGATPTTALLHVDHVVPVADGGQSIAANLVTSCRSCNLGKSKASLEESQLESQSAPEALLEQAAQIRAYLTACQALQDAKDSVEDAVLGEWERTVDPGGMLTQTAKSLGYWIETIGLERVFEAVRAVARKGIHGADAQGRYLVACMKIMREGKWRT